MDIGICFFFRNPPRWQRPFARFYEEQLDLVVQAEALGVDTIWLSEHHFAEDGYSPSLLPLASAIAARTSHVRIGTNVMLLPLHNAIRVAEDAAIVDILSDGRLDLGLGQGYSHPEFKGYGVPLKERPGRFEEGIEVIRGLWREDVFSFAGKHYRIEDARLNPRPVQQPMPPLWGGARNDKAIDRLARLGLHFLGSGLVDKQKTYDDALRRYGRDPAHFHAAQLRFVHVAPSRDQAWDEVQEHLHYMLDWYARVLYEAEGAVSEHGKIPEMPPPSALRDLPLEMLGNPAIGSPQEVADMLLHMKSEMRMTHLIAAMSFAGMDPAISARSIEMFARSVVPALRP